MPAALALLANPRAGWPPAAELRMPALREYLRRMWRAALTQESLLTQEEAVEALPGADAGARAWLLASVAPAGEVAGVPVFRWGDVVAAMSKPRVAEPEATGWLSTVEAAARLGISRTTLDGMVSRAPADLPGAPVHVGEGGRRKHLRWDAEHLDEWLAAYRSWEAQAGGKRVPARPSRKKKPRRRPAEEGPVDWKAVTRAFAE